MSVRPADPQNPLPVFTVDDPLTSGYSASYEQPQRHPARPARWSGAAMECVCPISRHEEYVARSRLSWFQEFASDGRSQLQRNQPIPAATAGFSLIYPYPSWVDVNHLRVTRGARSTTRCRRGLNAVSPTVSRAALSYTFQQTLTDLDVGSVGVAIGAGAGLQTIKDIRANYGPAPFDRPHRMVVNALYQLPFFKGRQDVLGKVAGDWQIGAIGTFQDGPALTPSSYGVPFVGSHANLLGDPNLPRRRTDD